MKSLVRPHLEYAFQYYVKDINSIEKIQKKAT